MDFPICGGTGAEEPADENVQGLVDKLAENIKSHTGKDYPHLKAVSFKTQCVAGTNYFVKIDAGHEHIHARIFEALPCHGGNIKLAGVQQSKSHVDSIEYF